MSFLEGSARVPLLISDPRRFAPKYIHQNVSNIDILPTLVDLVNGSLDIRLPMDGNSLVPYLKGDGNGVAKYDTVYGEYCGEGTVAPLMMIRSGQWKLVVCSVDQPQFFNINNDPHELHNLATSTDPVILEVFIAFIKEANARWDFAAIHNQVLTSQRTRRICWEALKQGRFESWDYQPREEASNKYVQAPGFALIHLHNSPGPILNNRTISANTVRHRYIRSNVPLDELELMARYPPVDALGREKPRGHAKGAAWG